jgi:hypothetical protein
MHKELTYQVLNTRASGRPVRGMAKARWYGMMVVNLTVSGALINGVKV